ncbi:MAG: amylo-alpha-1,6-glucosidase [Phycisphaerae bacterium]|nr:amylo-alpha-1,6-glucosidase [Phycisphaerae bacterium]
MTSEQWDRAEWLEADGLGGFASGTVRGIRTRRYHGLLLAARAGGAGRMVLVNGCDAWLETPNGTFSLTRQQYSPGVIHPDSGPAPESFTADPWPTWVLRCGNGLRVQCELFVPRGAPLVALSWRLLDAAPGVTLCVRPFLSGRDYHALHHENPEFRFEPQRDGGRLTWRTYDGVPDIHCFANGDYVHIPHWYRSFWYEAERERGLGHVEDLAAPGVLRFDLSRGEAALIFAADEEGLRAIANPHDAAHSLAALRRTEQARRGEFATPLHRAADSYVVRRGSGKTIIAGYPWFTDWGRDTFIALRGLCLATQRFDDAAAILLEWSSAVSDGMLPNRFPDQGEAPEYNAVDASLWYVIAVHEFLAVVDAGRARLSRSDRERLEAAVQLILIGYTRGTRFGIRCDEDGLLSAGRPGVQLTWMDAKVGDWVVTPRIGKPVELQALWLNALWCARGLSQRWHDIFVRGRESFRSRFWNAERSGLFDVVDCDHQPGTVDARFRPNQIFAVGGLPVSLLDDEQARQVVEAVEHRLLTPMGLRSLSPDEPEYTPHYRGDMQQRDAAYHQGTVWPWLIGPFVEAWLRVNGDTPERRLEARERFLRPLRDYAESVGCGHIAEVADGDPPNVPGGCPFQAWSLGEYLRLELQVLSEARAVERSSTHRPIPPAGSRASCVAKAH